MLLYTHTSSPYGRCHEPKSLKTNGSVTVYTIVVVFVAFLILNKGTFECVQFCPPSKSSKLEYLVRKHMLYFIFPSFGFLLFDVGFIVSNFCHYFSNLN